MVRLLEKKAHLCRGPCSWMMWAICQMVHQWTRPAMLSIIQPLWHWIVPDFFGEGGGTKRRLATIQGYGSQKNQEHEPLFFTGSEGATTFRVDPEQWGTLTSEFVFLLGSPYLLGCPWGVSKMVKPVISCTTLNGVYLASNFPQHPMSVSIQKEVPKSPNDLISLLSGTILGS